MTRLDVPHFIVKRELQKSAQTHKYFDEAVTQDVLADVCRRITGLTEFTWDYVDKSYADEYLQATYNKGRLAILEYQGRAEYISFSEPEVGGRNSSVQSVATAFNMYYLKKPLANGIYYYFLGGQANASTRYHAWIYRLMKTIGFSFLNADSAIVPFTSIEDIMHSRSANARRNSSNNSTYITKSRSNRFDIYGKTYGASKYETSLICYAASMLAQPTERITLYEMLEGDLRELPASSLLVLQCMGNVEVIPTDEQLERRSFQEDNSLRSARYTRNLLARLGPKHCALCGCEIPELIQGAHIWPVSNIKQEDGLTFEQKLAHATSGHNGIWLCENHHKLFDEGFITFAPNGVLMYRNDMKQEDGAFIARITPVHNLPPQILTPEFLTYLSLRNRAS